MVFFSFVVAPSAFAVLPSRQLAGELVNSSIGKVETIGVLSGTLLILFQAFTWSSLRGASNLKVARLIALILMNAANAALRFWIAPAMARLRVQMGGTVDNVLANDPVRVEFDRLHQYSVQLMGSMILLGILLLFLTVRFWMNRSAQG